MGVLIHKLIRKLSKYTTIKWFNDQLNTRTQNTLEKLLTPIIKEYSSKANSNVEKSKIIWLCWFQGYDKAPKLVQQCRNYLEKNISEDFTVKIITDKNYRDFIELPDFIIEKVDKGIITRTQLSDILRFSLLADYGGLWADATILVSKDISCILRDKDFFTLKSILIFDKFETISHGLWTGYFMMFSKGDITPQFLRDAFFYYWEKNTKLIDYFLVDYLISIAYKHIKSFNQQINLLEDNIGDNRYLLSEIFNREINKEDDDRLRKDKVGIYKTTYKKKGVSISENGITTYYGKFIDMIIN